MRLKCSDLRLIWTVFCLRLTQHVTVGMQTLLTLKIPTMWWTLRPSWELSVSCYFHTPIFFMFIRCRIIFTYLFCTHLYKELKNLSDNQQIRLWTHFVVSFCSMYKCGDNILWSSHVCSSILCDWINVWLILIWYTEISNKHNNFDGYPTLTKCIPDKMIAILWQDLRSPSIW